MGDERVQYAPIKVHKDQHERFGRLRDRIDPHLSLVEAMDKCLDAWERELDRKEESPI